MVDTVRMLDGNGWIYSRFYVNGVTFMYTIFYVNSYGRFNYIYIQVFDFLSPGCKTHFLGGQ